MKNRIAELRKNKKASQEDVAKALGITRQAISLYERGEHEPRLETWQKLADFFGVSVPYIQGIEPKLSAKDILKKIIPELHKEYFDNYLLLNGELPKDSFSISPSTTTTLNRLIEVKGIKKKPIDFYSKDDKQFILNPEIKKYWFDLLIPFIKGMYNNGWIFDNYISINTLMHFIDFKVTEQESKKNKMSILENYLVELHYFAFDEPLHHLMNTSIKYSDFEIAKKNFDKYFSFLKEVKDKVFSKSEAEVLKEAFESRLRIEERYSDEILIKKIENQVNNGDTKLARFLVETLDNWDSAYKKYMSK
ncbi:helix-turn-helix domain-containing protein [Lactobacillus helveticus]|uniref:helix-turn-helix domain-containing protein n=1 Tax=Lactobacillus helveticus TaxID=1587 RepID=UPI0021C2C4BD|nr:helix-turn-helix domain-containing protein [Lactobacillus helveticus]MCP9317820.1 helix-turn-helix domain-containing protein [Lactobacillus helveticus]MDH5818143.1 helix-turn-helix domain-containing protein [Lactobacillus helveticus]